MKGGGDGEIGVSDCWEGGGEVFRVELGSSSGSSSSGGSDAIGGIGSTSAAWDGGDGPSSADVVTVVAMVVLA